MNRTLRATLAEMGTWTAHEAKETAPESLSAQPECSHDGDWLGPPSLGTVTEMGIERPDRPVMNGAAPVTDRTRTSSTVCCR